MRHFDTFFKGNCSNRARRPPATPTWRTTTRKLPTTNPRTRRMTEYQVMNVVNVNAVKRMEPPPTHVRRPSEGSMCPSAAVGPLEWSAPQDCPLDRSYLSASGNLKDESRICLQKQILLPQFDSFGEFGDVSNEIRTLRTESR